MPIESSSDHLSQNIMALAGRVIFAMIFILSGISNIMHFSELSGSLAQHMLVSNAGLLLGLGIVLQLGGGIMVLLGLYTRIGALLLFIFIVPVTFLFYAFWMYGDGVQILAQLQHFMKNIAMCGAALYIIAFGGGRFSLDAWLRKRQ